MVRTFRQSRIPSTHVLLGLTFVVISLAGLFMARRLTAAGTFTPGNLALLVANGTGNNVTGSIVEISATSAGGAIQTIALPDTTNATDSFRTSASATSTGYVSSSNDRSLLTVTGHNSTRYRGQCQHAESPRRLHGQQRRYGRKANDVHRHQRQPDAFCHEPQQLHLVHRRSGRPLHERIDQREPLGQFSRGEEFWRHGLSCASVQHGEHDSGRHRVGGIGWNRHGAARTHEQRQHAGLLSGSVRG